MSWQDRLKTERAELEQRLDKLDLFLDSPECRELDIVEQRLLVNQARYMQGYLDILTRRIERLP